MQISKTVRPSGRDPARRSHSQGTQSNLLVFENPEQTSSFGSGYIGIILHSVTPDAWVVIGILIFMMLVSWLVMVAEGRLMSAAWPAPTSVSACCCARSTWKRAAPSAAAAAEGQPRSMTVVLPLPRL